MAVNLLRISTISAGSSLRQLKLKSNVVIFTRKPMPQGKELSRLLETSYKIRIAFYHHQYFK